MTSTGQIWKHWDPSARSSTTPCHDSQGSEDQRLDSIPTINPNMENQFRSGGQDEWGKSYNEAVVHYNPELVPYIESARPGKAPPPCLAKAAAAAGPPNRWTGGGNSNLNSNLNSMSGKVCAICSPPAANCTSRVLR